MKNEKEIHSSQRELIKTSKVRQICIDNNEKGSKFRILNEYLYTNQSSKAIEYFGDNKELFDNVNSRKLYKNGSIIKDFETRSKVGQ